MLANNPPECLISEEVVQSLHPWTSALVFGSDARENIRHWLTRSDASRRDKLLACGAFIVAELRLQVLVETEFTCSAGIAHNKAEIFNIFVFGSDARESMTLSLEVMLFVSLWSLYCLHGASTSRD
ncbi:hypothetical protein H5410_002344 [Solanum commersonii]|uniref:Uncharacterized protein n=1 Tax=Solanum commersonii TaxID=4109 RepID=A0A9J6B222_SOLCO|nr:hypothetical protein H5410_002344 [Solanum commersonii]